MEDLKVQNLDPPIIGPIIQYSPYPSTYKISLLSNDGRSRIDKHENTRILERCRSATRQGLWSLVRHPSRDLTGDLKYCICIRILTWSRKNENHHRCLYRREWNLVVPSKHTRDKRLGVNVGKWLYVRHASVRTHMCSRMCTLSQIFFNTTRVELSFILLCQSSLPIDTKVTIK